MIRRSSPRRILLAAVTAALAVLATTATGADGGGRWEQLDRWPAEMPSPTGQSVAVECNPGAEPGTETWPEAAARLTLNERHGHSRLTVQVWNARPDTLYTIWLRLLGVDSEGQPYGGSPLTGIPVTPFVDSATLPDQLAATLPNPGDPDPVNGFRTDARGRGQVTINVDFPVASGAYPFQRFPDFEALKGDIALTNPTNVGRLGGQPAAIRPVAITDGSQAPATFLVASHCVDDLGHGLLPGPHENWFTWAVG